MFARVARYQVPVDRVDEAVDSFRGASDDLRQLGGFAGGQLLVEQEEGEVVTLTLWNTRGDLEESRSRAARLRQDAVKAVEGTVLSVTEYEVAQDFASG